VLDAFAYAKGEIGGMRGTVRLGKHTLQWGESLFFGQNGIANAQGPVDIAKIVSVPGWQFKEVLLPVEQISGSLQVAEGVSLGAYYQFKWRPSKIPGVGSYFSNQDYVGTGVVNFGVDGSGNPILLSYDKSQDLAPKDSGQFGVQLRWSPAGSETARRLCRAVPRQDALGAGVRLCQRQRAPDLRRTSAPSARAPRRSGS
jgi:hypothetical protein